jgi:DNA-binding beta-propeller fold protein YncE
MRKAALTASVVLALGATAARAAPIDVTGDVFVGAGNGQVFQYTPTGTLVQKLSSGLSSETTGMAFDASGNLYSTNFGAQTIVVYDTNGTKVGTFGSGFNADPESIVFDKSGNAFVGQADGTHNILMFNSAGTLIKTIVPGPTDRGTDWIDLSSDQHTLYYAGEGIHIRTVDAVSGATGTFTSNGANLFALRLLSNGNILAANGSDQVVEFDSAGNVIKTYIIPGGTEIFALNLDPNGTAFWTGDIGGSTGVWEVDIATGNILEHWNASKDGATEVAGLAVFGEITQGGGGPGGGTTVPEPASLVMLLSGLGGLVVLRRRRSS